MRIQNQETLVSHGNRLGRQALVKILEAGLQGADPYQNTKRLLSLRGDKLTVGGKEFEPQGTPRSGDAVYDLSQTGNIYVIGAGKGIQRVALALEEVLGDRLTDGHVIDKKGYPVILNRIGVSLGGHPVPDEDCIAGCMKILEIAKRIKKNDVVFTCIGNGVSSLLTLPVPGVTLEDIKRTTYIMQIEHGAATSDLGPIRNHLDMLKGGRISRYISPANAIHILAIDPGSHDLLMHKNSWLHTLPDSSTFRLAIDNLKKWGAWEEVPRSVREFLIRAEPEHETVKAAEFERMPSRIFGVMPGHRQTAKLPPAIKAAEALGFKPVVLAEELMWVEAQTAGIYLSEIARTIERRCQPFEPPCALFTSGEYVVTVGKEKGVGGRNQEFLLSAALRIAGSQKIVIGSVDTDGNDGPSVQFADQTLDLPCLAGGIVDGMTVEEAANAGINIATELKRHNSTPVLLKLNSGIIAEPNISLNDLTVALVMG